MNRRVVMLTPHTLSHRTAEETLALGYLGRILREKGWDTVVIDAWLENLNPSQILERALDGKTPDLLCFSCYRSNLAEAKELLMFFHEKLGNIPSVCGGYGPTFHDEDFLNAGFTVSVRGEAEHIIAELVEALCRRSELGHIPGITFKDDDGKMVRTQKSVPVENLDLLLFPIRDTVESSVKRRNPIHICTSRGCMAHCTFCSVIAFTKDGLGSPWRSRSVENIVDELRSVVENYRVYHFKFVDDSFLEPPRDERWVESFAELLERQSLSIRFRTQVRADRLTPAIVRGLKRAGWFATSVGIENGSARALKRMGKSATVHDNLTALALLKEYGIYVQMGMILFDHMTNIGELEENYNFLTTHDWVVTKGIFTEMFAAQGTPFTRNLLKKDLLKVGLDNQNYSFDVQDSTARRVHHLLKEWHRAHAQTYDWVIDSISAPKVLPDEGYKEVHILCRELLHLDLMFFRTVLDFVKTDQKGDERLLAEEISTHAHQYITIRNATDGIYRTYDLVYDGILNPFLC